MKLTHKNLPFFCLCLMLLGVKAESLLAQPKPIKYPTVQAALTQMDNDAELQSAIWGYYVKSVSDGEVIAAYNPMKSLRPASALKVLTTTAALSVLGPDYTFSTKIEYDGVIDGNGVLQGNLYITGGGDPTLATNRSDMATPYKAVLNQWVTAIQQRGITKIEGRVIGDAGYFPDDMIPKTWIWEDIGNYYGAGVSGLNFHENRYDLILSSGKTGAPTKIVNILPEVPGLQITNDVASGSVGVGDQAYIYGSPFNLACVARGVIPPNQSNFVIRGAVPEPAHYAAFCLQQALEQMSILVSQPATTIRQLTLSDNYKSQQRYMLYVNSSPPLSKIVYWCNKRSINLFAETLLREMGKKQYGKGTIDNGVKAIKQFWQNRGIDLHGSILCDGSGLSPSNAISARQLTEVMASYATDINFNDFYKSLPVAGDASDDGFLKSFMNNKSSSGKVNAKSGYISNNRAYSGYIKTKSGRLLAFTVMVNNYSCSNSAVKKKIEDLLLPLTLLD